MFQSTRATANILGKWFFFNWTRVITTWNKFSMRPGPIWVFLQIQVTVGCSWLGESMTGAELSSCNRLGLPLPEKINPLNQYTVPTATQCPSCKSFDNSLLEVYCTAPPSESSSALTTSYWKVPNPLVATCILLTKSGFGKSFTALCMP